MSYFNEIDTEIRRKLTWEYELVGVPKEKAAEELEMLAHHGFVPWINFKGRVYFVKRELLEQKSIPTLLIESRGPDHCVFCMSQGWQAEIECKKLLKKNISFTSYAGNENRYMIFAGTRWGNTPFSRLPTALHRYSLLERTLREMYSINAV